MARASVELIVDAAKAINPLRAVKTASKKAQDQIDKLKKTVKNVGAAFQDLRVKAGNALKKIRENAKGANEASGAFAGFGKKLGGLAAAFVSINVAQSAFRTGIARIESERRIELLGKQFGEFAELQDVAAKAAQKFKLSITEANEAIANAFARLRPLGVSLQDISSTFGGFRTAAILGGSTAAEAAASFTQLSQALGSGALRGDEFRSIAEQAPLVLQAISDETGIAAGELKEYAAEGLLTSDIVIKALKRIETDGAERLTKALNGPAAKIKEFQNAVQDVQVAISQDILPELTDSFAGLAELIRSLSPLMRGFGATAGKVLGIINSQIRNTFDDPETAARGDIAAGILPAQSRLEQLLEPLGGAGRLNRLRQIAKHSGSMVPGFPEGVNTEILLDLIKQDLKTIDAKRSTLPSNFESMVLAANDPGTILNQPGDSTSPGKDPVKIAEALAEKSREKVRSLEQQALLASAITDEERTQFERQIEIANILENTNKHTKEQLEAQLEATFALHDAEDSTAAINAANDQRKKDEDALAKKLEEQQKTLSKLDQTYLAIGQSVSNGIVDALSSAVEGTKALADVAADTLRQVANILLQFGVNTALGGIPGLEKFFGGARANGGSVTGGSSYLVGEKGPELFTPGRSGSISPSGSFGGANVTVNVDASGSNVQGDQPNAKALGSAIGAAVQSELIKQKRPGGLLAS